MAVKIGPAPAALQVRSSEDEKLARAIASEDKGMRDSEITKFFKGCFGEELFGKVGGKIVPTVCAYDALPDGSEFFHRLTPTAQLRSVNELPLVKCDLKKATNFTQAWFSPDDKRMAVRYDCSSPVHVYVGLQMPEHPGIKVLVTICTYSPFYGQLTINYRDPSTPYAEAYERTQILVDERDVREDFRRKGFQISLREFLEKFPGFSAEKALKPAAVAPAPTLGPAPAAQAKDPWNGKSPMELAVAPKPPAH